MRLQSKKVMRYSIVILAIWILSILLKGEQNNQVDLKNLKSAVQRLATLQKRPAKYQYSPPLETPVVGKPFNVSNTMLDYLNIPLPTSQLFMLTELTVKHYVITTAGDSSFFDGMYTLLTTIEEHLPNYKTIVYDMGFKADQVNVLKSACNVEVRKFNFTKYPLHVKNKALYAWKPLIIHEILLEYPGVLWLDSSARILSSNLTDIYNKAVHGTKGIVMLSYTGHSNYAVTHPTMYEYLPSEIERLKMTEQWEANSMLIFRTHYIYNNIVKWAALCALDVKCIAPIKNRYCSFKQDKNKEYANCHRFDQAAFNVLLANLFHFDAWSYYVHNEFVHVERFKSNTSKRLKHC